MTTRLKTVEFAFPQEAAVTDNTLTTLTQITVYLPETGTKTFRSVYAVMSAQQTATAAGNVTSRNLQCRLGSAGYTANNNANSYTGSGEDIHLFHAVDLTSHFNTNWSGTSMTMDCQVQLDGTATSVAWTNVCVTVHVTYEYDDTSTTQVKTVRIPLDMPVGTAGVTKPGTALATIPALDTELPESSKTYRSTHIVIQGNGPAQGASNDATMTMQLDSTASHTSGIFEAGQSTDYFWRYVWDCSAVLDTSTSMGWYWWANLGRFNHSQAWLVVTYEFDASASSDTFVSLMLPMELASPMGGTTSSDYQRSTRELWIEEPGTVTTKQVAFYSFWNQTSSISGLNMRVGTGSFVSYTDAAATLAGSNVAMTRNDSAFTLARGRNSLNFDIYRTDTLDRGWNISGFWIVNYTASKPTQGYGAANHTILHNLGFTFDSTFVGERTTSATAPSLPETDYFINAVGTECRLFAFATNTPAGVVVSAERLASGEGGVQWETLYADICETDPETGLVSTYSQARTLFGRWPDDTIDGYGINDRIDLLASRRYRFSLGGLNITASAMLNLIYTYHTITFDVSGTVSGYVDADGAGLTVGLHRAANGELVKTTTTTTGGDFTFTWYDDTENVFTSCQEDATHVGRSASDVAA